MTDPEPPQPSDLERRQWLARREIAKRATIELVLRETDEVGVLLVPKNDGIDAA